MSEAQEPSKADEGQSRLTVGLGIKYCHMHGKHNCQTCIDGWVDAGIEQDKIEIRRLRGALKDIVIKAERQRVFSGGNYGAQNFYVGQIYEIAKHALDA